MAFAIVPVTAADASFSPAGSAAWAAGMTVSGATVGGIPYCPTATTIVTGSGLMFNASGAAGEGLAIAAGTATTNVQAQSVTQAWNAAGVAFTAKKTNITNTASAAGSLVEDWQVGGTSIMSLSPNASVTSGPQLQVGSGSAGSTGWKLGTVVSGFAGMWPTDIATPSGTNYAFAAGGGNTYINIQTGKTLFVLSNGATSVFGATSNGANFSVPIVAQYSGIGLRVLNGTTTTGANVGTLTNCPHSGNPDLYWEVSINGTAYAIPAFALT